MACSATPSAANPQSSPDAIMTLESIIHIGGVQNEAMMSEIETERQIQKLTRSVFEKNE